MNPNMKSELKFRERFVRNENEVIEVKSAVAIVAQYSMFAILAIWAILSSCVCG